ncbi:MarR family transcriptional regulator [Egibacter rhizosphaerae]|uniref:MarR family transcriptional regulator n=1 Tax=Egibacter rhizosphaerae TaxID=1670831 RepID=A0A411YF87_9ACTN|nr:MarR family transcriptional regulator [Egibacter rhizosphaerae]QBI19888.1 MarR family transcriptional regulator [Egibacter rhizosphaerae]
MDTADSRERANPDDTSADDGPEPLVVERADGLKHLPPTRAHAFLGLVRAGTALSRDLSARLEARHGLSLHAFEVLLHLAVFSPDGRLGLRQLVEQAPLSQSRVSRMVARLEADGLVTREHDPDDARGVDVAITDAGVDVFRRAQETHLADLDERFFSRLSWDDITRLATITEKLLADEDA